MDDRKRMRSNWDYHTGQDCTLTDGPGASLASRCASQCIVCQGVSRIIVGACQPGDCPSCEAKPIDLVEKPPSAEPGRISPMIGHTPCASERPGRTPVQECGIMSVVEAHPAGLRTPLRCTPLAACQQRQPPSTRKERFISYQPHQPIPPSPHCPGLRSVVGGYSRGGVKRTKRTFFPECVVIALIWRSGSAFNLRLLSVQESHLRQRRD